MAFRKVNKKVSADNDEAIDEAVAQRALRISAARIPIQGVAPLLVSCWYSKFDDAYDQQRFVDRKGIDCLPVSFFQAALVASAPQMHGMTKAVLRRSIFVSGDEDGNVPLRFSRCEPLVCHVRNDYSRKTAERERPCYHDWSCELDITWIENELTLEEVVSIVRLAGEHVGIGTGRPELADGRLMRRKRTYNSVQIESLPTMGTFTIGRLGRAAA